MAIGALQTGYTTLYGKIAGLGTQNGQTRGSNFREHIDGTEKKAPYQHLAQNGTITYKGVTFARDWPPIHSIRMHFTDLMRKTERNCSGFVLFTINMKQPAERSHRI